MKTNRMPVLFIGHGSPMNAIEQNDYTRMLANLSGKIDKPKSILTISAHWMTEGTWVLGMDHPKTIHDFYGFPQKLFDVQYPAPGSPETAKLVQRTLKQSNVKIDMEQWGFDHGTWSVLRHIYPEAEIPVVQLSLYMASDPQYHYQIGQQLAHLREQNVLIVASGNIVHNLSQIVWSTHAQPFDWAIEFDAWVKQKLESRNFETLIDDFHKSRAGKLSVPTTDHYLPLLYIIGAAHTEDELHFEFEEIHNASIDMRTFGFWAK